MRPRHILAAALLLFARPAAAQESGQTFRARVVEVTDGDTYLVQRSDAPETSQPYGIKAMNRARQYIGGVNVRVTIEEIGRYGRAVARIGVQ